MPLRLSFRTWKSSALSSVWITWLRWPRPLLSGRLTGTCSKISYVEPAAVEPSKTDLNRGFRTGHRGYCGDSEGDLLKDFITPSRLHIPSLRGGYTLEIFRLSPSLSNLLFISFQTRTSVFITLAVNNEVVSYIDTYSSCLPQCLTAFLFTHIV